MIPPPPAVKVTSRLVLLKGCTLILDGGKQGKGLLMVKSSIAMSPDAWLPPPGLVDVKRS